MPDVHVREQAPTRAEVDAELDRLIVAVDRGSPVSWEAEAHRTRLRGLLDRLYADLERERRA